MVKKLIQTSALVVILGFTANAAMACGGEASGKHIGSMLQVNADKSTFTIRDMETNSPITFNANQEIMSEVQKASGRVMVNYEENDEGALVATGVAF